MNGNLAYQKEIWEETLNGKIYLMSPRPLINHNRIAFNISMAFHHYLKGKTCETFSDGVDVHLTENDCVIPDAMIVCNRDIIKRDGIYGAPDLIVEVLSPSTAKNDRGYKKNLYEKSGVKEYWIVIPETRSVEVYLLNDGTYELNDVYSIFPEEIKLTEEEKALYKDEVKVSLYDDFSIPLDEIFDRLF